MKVTYLYDKIYKHLQECLPREACGIIGKKDNIVDYYPCTNIAEEEYNFIIDPEEVAYLEDTGVEFLYIVHTHPITSCEPSLTDLEGLKEHNIPWLIMDASKNVSITTPEQYASVLEGRLFKYGTLDCYTLSRDYYKNKYNLDVKDFPRLTETWWQDYGENFEEVYTSAGFIRVYDIKPDDLLVFNLNSPYPNHFAIYLGNNNILHHAVNRFSCIEPINRQYTSNISYILRKKELV